MTLISDYRSGSVIDRCGSEELCLYVNENYLGWEKNGIGRMMIFMAAQGFAYFALLLFFESRYSNRFQYALNKRKERSHSQLSDIDNEYTPLLAPNRSISMIQEDTDVATERARLANTPVEDLFTSDSLIIKEVTKYYDNNLAVDHSSVGISQGECFGLLGVNGAGKTTTDITSSPVSTKHCMSYLSYILCDTDTIQVSIT
jgi:ABC-type multidrug transport system fused ATPase/permease subunit